MLALVTDAYGGPGGIAQYNRDLLGAVIETGVAFSVVALPRYAAGPVAPPSGIAQMPPRSGRLAYSLAALRTALTGRFDVVFCGHLFMAPLAWAIARLMRAKLVVQAHGIESWQRPGALTRKAVEAADLVLCVSRFTRAALLAWADIAPARVLVQANTVGAQFTPGDATALRTAWGLQDKRVLLSVGRMSRDERYKGQDRVIRTLTQLTAAGIDVVYVVVGEGDDRARLQALAESEGVAERVRFVGAVEASLLPDIYRMADLFVMPSTGEGFGIAFLEAMACGTRVLGLAAGGSVDALADMELATMADEREFPAALEREARRPKTDGAAAAVAVQDRFGHARFKAGVATALSRLSKDAVS